MEKVKVLVIGCNPAVKSPDCTPFHPSTRSRKTIDGWFSEIDADVSFMNIYDQKTPGNRPISSKLIEKRIGDVELQLMSFKNHKIVTVGRAAESILDRIGVNFLAMPHPSGQNRLLNDKSFVSTKLSQLSDYIKS